VFIVIEKESEVGLVIEEANELKLTPQVGLRVRLSSLASSKWADTGGERSKFGLSAAQLLSVIERFRAVEMDQGIRLLHFHMGSQIANLADYRQGFREAIRYYAELRALGLAKGFRFVESGPLVRSSYHAEKHVLPAEAPSEDVGGVLTQS